jgi:hypothetical protein
VCHEWLGDGEADEAEERTYSRSQLKYGLVLPSGQKLSILPSGGLISSFQQRVDFQLSLKFRVTIELLYQR